jgi:hypothetical protein
MNPKQNKTNKTKNTNTDAQANEIYHVRRHTHQYQTKLKDLQMQFRHHGIKIIMMFVLEF